MKIGVYYVSSPNVANVAVDRSNQEMIGRMAEKSGLPLEFIPIEEAKTVDQCIVFIGGGGTENYFKAVMDQLPRPVILLTTGTNNSLAASMEILSYLHQNNIPGEIIHGSEEDMIHRIALISKAQAARKNVQKLVLGRVGKPSDWLISSDVDAKVCEEKTGIRILDISMEEFFAEIAKQSYEPNAYTEALKAKNFHPEDTEKCLQIYGALKRLVIKYGLKGVTVRCFDLLEPLHETGCLALAILNAEGYYAGCEGDTPALISMAILGELTGKSSFMCNPSRILSDEKAMILAHCTLPMDLPDSYTCMTHYESGFGVGLRGHIPEGPATIFKTSGYLDRHFVYTGAILKNLQEACLCRTQIKFSLSDEAISYFLHNPIGNHHLVVPGDYSELIEEFYKW